MLTLNSCCVLASRNPFADATLPDFATLSLSTTNVVKLRSPAKHVARWLDVLQATNYTQRSDAFFYFRWKFLTNVRPESFTSMSFRLTFLGSGFLVLAFMRQWQTNFSRLSVLVKYRRRSFLFPPYATSGLSHRLSVHGLEMLLEVTSLSRFNLEMFERLLIDPFGIALFLSFLSLGK